MVNFSLLSLVLSIFLLIGLGFFAKSINLLADKDGTILNKVIIYLTLPAFIFRAVRSSPLAFSALYFPVVAFVVALVSLIFAWFLGKIFSLKKLTLGSFLIAASVGNTGYLGYPLTQELFGPSNLVKAIFYDVFGTVFFLFTIGLVLAESYGTKNAKINKAKELLTFPPLITLVIGYLLRDLPLPLFLSKALDFLSETTIPLIMISLGLSLRLGKVGNYFLPLVGVGFLKLIFAPLVAILIGKSFSLGVVDLKITILEASMPIAMLVSIMGIKYRLDNDFLSASILLTTALSLITIPFWQQFALRFI